MSGSVRGLTARFREVLPETNVLMISAALNNFRSLGVRDSMFSKALTSHLSSLAKSVPTGTAYDLPTSPGVIHSRCM